MKCQINLELNLSDDMLQDFDLHGNVPHDTCVSEVLVQDNTLQAHLIPIITIFSVVGAFVSSDQVEKDHTQIYTDVLMLLVAHDLVEAWELDLLLLDKLSQVS